MTPGAIVVGAHVNGLGVIRALAARGIPTVAITTQRFDIAHRSRWVSEWHALPGLHEDGAALAALLERHADRWGGWAVFPTNDDAITALGQHHERLVRWYRLTVPPWNVMADLVEKDRLHALAQRVGLDVPACHGPAGEVRGDRTDLPLPLIVKPLRHDRLIAATGAKVFVARDRRQLREAIDRLEGLGLAGVIFEFIEGADSEIFVYGVYMSADGEPSAGITIRKLRQTSPGIGSARVVEVAPEQPELREATVALLRESGFRGMAFAEFKRDSRTGAFRFIEVNGRAVLFNAILPPTGLDLVAMTWADHVLGAPLRPERTSWRGRWIHLEADVVSSWRHRREERLGAAGFLAPYRGPRVWAVWSALDPAPFFAQAALFGWPRTRPSGGSRRANA